MFIGLFSNKNGQFYESTNQCHSFLLSPPILGEDVLLVTVLLGCVLCRSRRWRCLRTRYCCMYRAIRCIFTWKRILYIHLYIFMQICMCVYFHANIHTYLHIALVCICIYIDIFIHLYRERERDRPQIYIECVHLYIHTYLYSYIVQSRLQCKMNMAEMGKYWRSHVTRLKWC